MKFFISTTIAIVFFIYDAQTQSNNVKIYIASSGVPTSNEAVANFSEGCFWHAEIIVQNLVGIGDAVSAYAGGHTTNPDYEKVASGQTGHAETVQVYYDPSKISYKTLVRAFLQVRIRPLLTARETMPVPNTALLHFTEEMKRKK